MPVGSILHGKPLTFGPSAKQELLLALTLIFSLLAIRTGRTIVLQGLSHLANFAVCRFFAVVPEILRLAASGAFFFDPKTLFVYVSPFERPLVSRRSSIRHCLWPHGNESFTRE